MTAPTLKEYALRIRHHDWTACMSDSWQTARRGDQRRKELAALAKTSPNHARLWELGLGHHGPFTWEASPETTEEDLASRWKSEWTRAGVNETAWRWVGAYLWVHGVRLTEDEAKALVGDAEGYKDWYGSQRSTAKDVDWKAVDALVKEAA